MYTIRRAATGFVKDYLAPPNARNASPIPAPGAVPSSTTDKTIHPSPDTHPNIPNIAEEDGIDNFPESPLSYTSDPSEHSFAEVEVDPRRPHDLQPFVSKRRDHDSFSTNPNPPRTETNKGYDTEYLRKSINRPNAPVSESESESESELDDLESDDFPLVHGTGQGQTQTKPDLKDTKTQAKLQTHSYYPPLLNTVTLSPKHHHAQNTQTIERWRAFGKTEDISEWSVVRNSKKDIADFHRLREEYEAKLNEKEKAMEKERATWEWVKKDLVERQKQELNGMRQRFEGDINGLKNDLQKTQALLVAGNEELQMARDILKQHGANDAAHSAAIDTGIHRLKNGYEDRLREKEKMINEQRSAHEEERLELTEALRDAEKQMEIKEERWQEEKQQLLLERDQLKAHFYVAQSNATEIDKLRDDLTKTEDVLNNRTKELEKAQSQLKKIHQKWKELQDKARRGTSSDVDQVPSPTDVKRLFQGPDIRNPLRVPGRDTSTRSDIPAKLDVKRLSLLQNPAHISPTANGDSTSFENVIRLLESLNSDILQFAAQFTDDIEQLGDAPVELARQNTELSEGERAEAMREMSGLLGNRLVGYLSSSIAMEDFDIVSQCALQAILLQWLKDIYTSIKAAGNQETARRWRALTRAQSRVKWEGESDTIIERVSVSVMRFLALITAGRRISIEDEESKRQLTHQKVASILETAFQINKAIGEGITSTDYEVFCPRPGEPFDKCLMTDDNEMPVVGKYQSDDESDRKKIRRKDIICTCQLGLCRIVGEPSSSFTRQQAVVSKARVLLASALTDWEENLKRIENVTLFSHMM